MDAIVKVAETASDRETDRQLALLNWARTMIDRIAAEGDANDRIHDLLDFMAHFTREYFGFQERLLAASNAEHEHLLERQATHAQFRRRLAHTFADAVSGDPSVPKRLSELCHELWLDVQTQRDEFSAVVHRAGTDPMLRRHPRPDSESLRAILRANS